MPTKRSLKLNSNSYKYLLKRHLKHSGYLNGFKTFRKQNDHFDTQSPAIDDFILGTETFGITKPYPIVRPYAGENETDLCAKLLSDKSGYKEELQRMIPYFKTDKKFLTQVYAEKPKFTKLPKYMIDLCVENISDPDEHFDGNYNWYYSDGILSHVKMENDDFLIVPLPNNDLRIINTSDNTTKIRIDKEHKLSKTPIYSTKVYTSVGDVHLLIRQRNQITIFDILNGKDFSLFCTCTKTTKDAPFVDAKYRDGDLTYLDVTRKLCTMNFYGNRKFSYRLKKSEKELPDSFLHFDYTDDNNFCVIDRKNLRLIDSRSKEEDMLCMEDGYFVCDDLSAVAKEGNSPYIFLGSLHNLRKFDTRTNSVVKSWAHMLHSAPYTIKLTECIYGNMIFMSTQQYDDRVILCSNAEESNIVQAVPNNLETMIDCNTAYNFDLEIDSYERRLLFLTAGIEVVPHDNGVHLYTCNTLGDVFKNDVTKSKIQDNKSIEEFFKWTRNFESTAIKPVVASHIRNMEHVKRLLREPPNTDTLEIYRAANKKRSRFIADNTLNDTSLGKIWWMEKKEESEGDESMPPAISARSKVAEWLQRTKYDSELDLDDTENMSFSRFTQD